MASLEAIWGPATLRFVRIAVTNTVKAARERLGGLSGQAQHIPVRAGRQPIHPAAFLKQQKQGARWYSSSTTANLNHVVRRFFTSGRASGRPARFDRSKLPTSKTSRRVAQFSGRAPFASTLRPNLTGGAMPRSAGGYGLGGGSARYFSHTPAAPAQVIQNVSQAMRAFLLSGQKLRYEGVGPRGQMQYRAVSNLEDDAMRKLAAMPRTTPGSYIDFQLSPTITALSPLAAAIVCASGSSGFNAQAAAVAASLNTDGFLDVLSADFGRTLQDLTAVFGDIQRLSILGDLPISLQNNHTLRVRFPGVDAWTVDRICDDIGIQRGVVQQDPDFDTSLGVPVALKFPFAPTSEATLTSPGGSVRSIQSREFDEESSLDDDSFIREAFATDMGENPWVSDTEGYESMSPPVSSGEHSSQEFQGLEGIYRFLEECDRAEGRLG